MLTENDFRRIALGMKDAIESAHMGHPDFRANGRIFATLHHDRQWANGQAHPGATGRVHPRPVRRRSSLKQARGDAKAAPLFAWTPSTRRPSARR